MPAFRFLSCFVPLLLTAAVQAQSVAGSFSPNPAPIGVPVTFTGTDATGQGCQLPSPCGWYRIHQGSQTGPVVPLGIFCIQVIVPVGPNGTFSFTWNQRDANNQQVPAGHYWFEVRTWDSSFSTLNVNWFCLAIQTPGTPALSAAGPARLGLNTPMQISAPGEAGALWIAVCSLDANNPIPFPGLEICLSFPIFLEPFTTAFGVLDGSGNSNGLELIVPGAPHALWQGLHVQALILGPTWVMTNDVSFTIQP
ncbi:MAG TPA: hypothetical protein VF384_11775 [Planctomycetota bacterium]